MKEIKLLAVIGLALIVGVLPSQAQQKAFSGSGTVLSNTIDTVTYYVAPARSVPQGPAVLQYVNCHSDLSTAVLQFYNCTNAWALDATNVLVSGASAATNIPTLGITNGTAIISNGVCVIRHTASDTYERNRFYSGSTSNIVFMYPLVNTTSAGDIVYACAKSGSILIGTNNPAANATTIGPVGDQGGIAYGNLLNNANTPFLIEINGTTINPNVSINVASGRFMP